MNNRLAQEIMRRDYDRRFDNANGLPPSPLRLAADRAASMQIGDISKLPVEGDGPKIQADDGTDIFLLDYSQLDGGSVVG